MTENEELKKAALQLKAMVICTSIKTHRSCSGCVNENDCGKEEYDTDKVFAKSANIIFDTLEEFESYQSIGTIDEFKALKEKSEPKKPTEKELPYSEEVGLNSEWHCPACGSYVGYFTEGMNEPEQMEYCNVCGQHIAKDWSE